MRLEPVLATVAALMLVLLAACSMKATSPVAPSRPAADSATPSTEAPTPEPKAAEPVARAEPAPPASTPTVTEKNADRSEAPAVVEKRAAKNEATAAKPAMKAPVPPTQQAPAKEALQAATKEAPQPAAKPKEPPLDLTSLESRLKDTKAIGIMTKISLKNQVDDLLNQFRAFYAGKLKTTLAELRRPYDLLVLKVLSLLQDADPSLAAAIVASREAIWGILSDPVKFADFASK